ncbi:MAG: hypothetical protein ACWA44_03170 [Thiotrichales bacterium]
MILNAEECQFPNRMFIVLYTVGLAALITLSVINQSISTGGLALIIVFGLLGGLALLKNISIIRCPTKVLIGAMGFITATAVIDKYLI